MIKFIVYGLSFMVYVTFTIYHIPYTIYAADSTPSADIKTKLEEFKKEIASKAAKLKLEVNRKLQDKAYVGVIKTKTPTSLTLATKTGPKIVTLNQDTIYQTLIKGKKNSYKTIALEDYVAGLGDIDETGVLTAKKIILLPTTNLPPKTYLWGQVHHIQDKLLTIKDRSLKNIAVTTNLAEFEGNLRINDFVIATGTVNKNEVFLGAFIYIIPQGGILKPKKPRLPDGQVVTPSAKSATLSGKKR